MFQMVYSEKFYMYGKISEVIKQLRELTVKFTTVKEFLEHMTKELRI